MPQNQRQNFSPESSWENLRALLDSHYKPEVLILGEYCPSDFDHPTYEEIVNHYPHVHRVVKSNPNYKKRNGLRVFSLYPLKVKDEVLLTHGNFASQFLEGLCTGEVGTSDALWSRHLSILEVEKPNKSFTLLPVHFANPWRPLARCANQFFVWAEIHRGQENLNYRQAQDLLNFVDTETKSLVIGDFNAPRRGNVFLNSKAYQLLEDFFGPNLISTGVSTYINKTGRYPNANIDHAFSIQLESQYGETLPLSGSDHLPILVGF